MTGKTAFRTLREDTPFSRASLARYARLDKIAPVITITEQTEETKLLKQGSASSLENA